MFNGFEARVLKCLNLWGSATLHVLMVFEAVIFNIVIFPHDAYPLGAERSESDPTNSSEKISQ